MGGGRVDGDEESRRGKFFQVGELEDGEVKVKILDTKGEIRFFYCGLPRVFFFFAKKLVSSKDEND